MIGCVEWVGAGWGRGQVDAWRGLHKAAQQGIFSPRSFDLRRYELYRDAESVPPRPASRPARARTRTRLLRVCSRAHGMTGSSDGRPRSDRARAAARAFARVCLSLCVRAPVAFAPVCARKIAFSNCVSA